MNTNETGRRLQRPLRLVVALALASACIAAQAQAHEQRQGSYLLRSSTVASLTFNAATAKAHGIEPAPTRAVLNVVVLHEQGGRLRTVHADVHASTSDLTGVRRDIELHEVVQNNHVSYIGGYDFAPREVLDFHVVAQPAGAKTPLSLNYRDRMWVP